VHCVLTHDNKIEIKTLAAGHYTDDRSDMGLLCVCLSVCLSVRHVVVLYLNIAIVGPSANKFGTVNLVGVDVVLAGLKFRSN